MIIKWDCVEILILSAGKIIYVLIMNKENIPWINNDNKEIEKVKDDTLIISYY